MRQRVQAADHGWSKIAPPGCMGLADVPLSGLAGSRRVQAWLYGSLNAGVLAARLQSLMLMDDLLGDWYFPWALLRTDGALQDVLVELVKVPPSPLSSAGRLLVVCRGFDIAVAPWSAGTVRPAVSLHIRRYMCMVHCGMMASTWRRLC